MLCPVPLDTIPGNRAEAIAINNKRKEVQISTRKAYYVLLISASVYAKPFAYTIYKRILMEDIQLKF